ncbi:MAG: fumarylacetoacetase [Kiloniellales bacterium]
MVKRSWVESARDADCPFPLQNLPYGIFSRAGEAPRCGVAIGTQVLDLVQLARAGLLPMDVAVFEAPKLNPFMASGPAAWTAVREQLTQLLAEGGAPRLREDPALQAICFLPLAEIRLHLPFEVRGYTDFYAGRQHAFNVGSLFRGPENALPPNWPHIPIGYNGRASTVVVSGTRIKRPLGQTKPPGADAPLFGPCKRLDIELEFGAVVGQGNEMGQPISVARAEEMIFGYVLLNDWSARDIQAWEYQPLGPFQAKAFATSISPWVVPKAALEPFRVPTPPRDKPLLPYLEESGPSLYDIELEVWMQPDGATQPSRISQTNTRHLYYSAAQQLAHHAIGGCKMECGDLLGSGTISGPDKSGYGSLLEMTWGGKEPLTLTGRETRSFIEDGDSLTLRGWAQGDGYRIGFGDCEGTILPAPTRD